MNFCLLQVYKKLLVRIAHQKSEKIEIQPLLMLYHHITKLQRKQQRRLQSNVQMFFFFVHGIFTIR